MLKDLFFLHYGYGAQFALTQSIREGKNVEKYLEHAKMIDSLSTDDPLRVKLMYAFWDLLDSIPPSLESNLNEPSTLPEILKLREKYKELNIKKLSKDELYDKVYGAWLGRVIGCLFGKPVEGLKRNQIKDILLKTNNYPMTDYIKVNKNELFCKENNINYDALVENYSFAMPDDDTNYTIIGLLVLEKYGRGFTSENVAEEWIKYLPALSCCTAEFCAYRNILNKVFPPYSASYRNPFREWIGAQIRGDIFGYVNPFNTTLAANYAFIDASISHTKNGIYGEMFVAAMLAASYANISEKEVIEYGLAEIPSTSRLYKKVKELLTCYDNGMSYDDFIEMIHKEYNEYDMSDSVHTIPNALIVVACLLYANGNIAKAMGLAVMCGFDTDCNGATVGSILGLLYGAKRIPKNLVDDINDTLASDIKDNYKNTISTYAKRTINIIFDK